MAIAPFRFRFATLRAGLQLLAFLFFPLFLWASQKGGEQRLKVVKADAVETQFLDIVADGKLAATLHVLPDGNPRLQMYDSKTGSPVVSLGIFENGRPGLALYDQKLTRRSNIHLDRDNDLRMEMYDKNGQNILNVGEEPGHVGLFVFDKKGGNRFALALHDGGDAVMQFSDEDGRSRARMLVSSNGATSTVLSNAKATDVLRLNCNSNGDLRILCFDPLGKSIFQWPNREN